ncbi:MAG: ferredoxin [Candidatus Dadabacteria bacterium]
MSKPTTPALSTVNSTLYYWKTFQFIFWLVGISLIAIMFSFPDLGVTLFWNILIPIAPALFVVGTGIWRNICPLATIALFPDKMGISKQKKLSNGQRNVLNLIGVVALFAIIPMRHILFDRNGLATALIVIIIGASAFFIGFFYERKSGWCSGVCPIHPVEKLYGSGVALTLPNAHCNECVRCSVPCPDSTPNSNAKTAKNNWAQTGVEYFIVGAFPGYVWGWFHVDDFTGFTGWNNLAYVYGIPLMSAVISLCIYLILRLIVNHGGQKTLVNAFAAAAVSIYYWYRLPMLFGWTDHQTNGVLINLTHILPSWTPIILNIYTTTFFVWWLVGRPRNKKSWAIRPAYAK